MIVYLASPYTHVNPDVREQRFREVCRIAGELMCRGVHVFSPIAHTHPIAVCRELPGDWDYWEEYDRKFLAVCGALWIAMLDGWHQSKGVNAEIEIARSMGLPIRRLDPLSLHLFNEPMWPDIWSTGVPHTESTRLGNAERQDWWARP